MFAFHSSIIVYRKSISYLIALAGILTCIVLVVIAYRDDQNPYTIASLIGSVASLFALVIAIIQIVSIKRISEATNKAVEETKDKIIHAISVSDVSKAIKLIEEVHRTYGHDNYIPVYCLDYLSQEKHIDDQTY